jgi:hypothetical protein
MVRCCAHSPLEGVWCGPFLFLLMCGCTGAMNPRRRPPLPPPPPAELDNSLFVRRAFNVFDEEEAGRIGFIPFVVGIWNYATLDHSALCVGLRAQASHSRAACAPPLYARTIRCAPVCPFSEFIDCPGTVGGGARRELGCAGFMSQERVALSPTSPPPPLPPNTPPPTPHPPAGSCSASTCVTWQARGRSTALSWRRCCARWVHVWGMRGGASTRERGGQSGRGLEVKEAPWRLLPLALGMRPRRLKGSVTCSAEL